MFELGMLGHHRSQITARDMADMEHTGRSIHSTLRSTRSSSGVGPPLVQHGNGQWQLESRHTKRALLSAFDVTTTSTPCQQPRQTRGSTSS